MRFQVLRTFNGDRAFKVGEIVDIDGKHVDKLVTQRYLQPLDLAPAKIPVTAESVTATESAPKRKAGRPKGSKNRTSESNKD